MSADDSRETSVSDDSEPVCTLAGESDGGLAVRESAPDGAILVLDPEEAAAFCSRGSGRRAAFDLLDDDDSPFWSDGI